MSRIAQPALPQPLSELSGKRSKTRRNQTTSAAIQMKNPKLHQQNLPENRRLTPSRSLRAAITETALLARERKLHGLNDDQL